MNTESRTLEKILAASAADSGLDADDAADWHEAGYTFRTHCNLNKIFVLWTPFVDSPFIHTQVTVRDVHLSVRNGMSVRVADKEGQTQWITHTPSKLLNRDVFCHVPYLLDVQYIPNKFRSEEMILRFPLVFKTASKPSLFIEGDTYITPVSEFRLTFPEFKNYGMPV